MSKIKKEKPLMSTSSNIQQVAENQIGNFLSDGYMVQI